jgi:hypothetical protein
VLVIYVILKILLFIVGVTDYVTRALLREHAASNVLEQPLAPPLPALIQDSEDDDDSVGAQPEGYEELSCSENNTENEVVQSTKGRYNLY